MNCVSFFALHSFHHPLFLLVSSLILSFILVTDFGCILNLHLPLFIIYYTCFLPVYFKKQFAFYIWCNISQGSLCTLSASAMYHTVICISDVSVSSSCQFLIKFVKHYVTKQRAKWTTLWYSYLCLFKYPSAYYSRIECNLPLYLLLNKGIL